MGSGRVGRDGPTPSGTLPSTVEMVRTIIILVFVEPHSFECYNLSMNL